MPTANIFVPVKERETVFRNVPTVIESIPPEIRSRSIYISKFLSAVAGGLFDAALNYLWDETILELRKRVSQYDLAYFFDNASIHSLYNGSINVFSISDRMEWNLEVWGDTHHLDKYGLETLDDN